MDILSVITDNFWASVALMLFIISIVSIVGGLLLEAYKTSIKASQKRMEMRNEEMRLQLKLQEQKKENLAGSSQANHPLPKEPSWEEQSQISYEMGYQQKG